MSRHCFGLLLVETITYQPYLINDGRGLVLRTVGQRALASWIGTCQQGLLGLPCKIGKDQPREDLSLHESARTIASEWATIQEERHQNLHNAVSCHVLLATERYSAGYHLNVWARLS